MENRVVIKWRFRGGKQINLLHVRGKIISKHSFITGYVLVDETLRAIKIAEANGGIFIPMKEFPKGEGEFSSFDVLFKSEKDLITFVETLVNRYP